MPDKNSGRKFPLLLPIFFALAMLGIFHSAQANGVSELEILRGIAAAEEANLSDLCDLVLLQRGEIAKHPDKRQRCKVLTELKIYNFSKISIPLIEPVTAGAAAKAAIMAHGLERTVMFAITGFEWYAVQNAEHLGLLPSKTAASKPLSGAELLAVFEKAARLADEKHAWGNPANPYEPFGVNSYEELNKAYDQKSKEK